MRGKTCRKRRKKIEAYESFLGKADSFHSNKAQCSFNVKDPILNVLLVIQMQKKKKRVKEDGTEIYIPQVFEAMSY